MRAYCARWTCWTCRARWTGCACCTIVPCRALRAYCACWTCWACRARWTGCAWCTIVPCRALRACWARWACRACWTRWACRACWTRGTGPAIGRIQGIRYTQQLARAYHRIITPSQRIRLHLDIKRSIDPIDPLKGPRYRAATTDLQGHQSVGIALRIRAVSLRIHHIARCASLQYTNPNANRGIGHQRSCIRPYHCLVTHAWRCLGHCTTCTPQHHHRKRPQEQRGPCE